MLAVVVECMYPCKSEYYMALLKDVGPLHGAAMLLYLTKPTDTAPIIGIMVSLSDFSYVRGLKC